MRDTTRAGVFRSCKLQLNTKDAIQKGHDKSPGCPGSEIVVPDVPTPCDKTLIAALFE